MYGLHEHARCAVTILDGVPQGAVVQIDGNLVLASLLHRLLDGDRHFACLAITETDLAFAVADNSQGGEGELGHP